MFTNDHQLASARVVNKRGDSRDNIKGAKSFKLIGYVYLATKENDVDIVRHVDLFLIGTRNKRGALRVNSTGSVEVMRDRFLRHSRRMEGDTAVPWEPEDEDLFALRERGDTGRPNTSPSWDLMSEAVDVTIPPSRRSTHVKFLASLPEPSRIIAGSSVSAVPRVASLPLSSSQHTSPLVSTASSTSVCAVTSMYGGMVRPTAYTVSSSFGGTRVYSAPRDLNAERALRADKCAACSSLRREGT